MDDLVSNLSTLGQIGAFGLVAWLVRHTFTHTIPRLASDFREMLTEQRQEFLAELKRLDSEGREDRKEFLTRFEELRSQVERFQELLRKFIG